MGDQKTTSGVPWDALRELISEDMIAAGVTEMLQCDDDFGIGYQEVVADVFVQMLRHASPAVLLIVAQLCRREP